MNKKIIISGVVIICVIALATISAKPKGSSGQEDVALPQRADVDMANMSVAVVPAEKVEIFLFHRTQRCTTCIAIGELSGQTVRERFGPEVMEGKVVFREVNIDESQNKELAEKFQASGSALFINAVRNGSDNIEQDSGVWRLTNSPEVFKNYLAEKINILLGK